MVSLAVMGVGWLGCAGGAPPIDTDVGCAVAAETCNGRDDDCDGVADDGLATDWFADGDGDGAGDPATAGCAGDVQTGGDCDDADATRSPAEVERCDGRDDDCDGVVDDGLPPVYRDVDGDGFGGEVVSGCELRRGVVADGGDCDDGDVTVGPDVAERCNGSDDDCDGVVDDGLSANVFFRDADGDGHGVASDPVIACAVPEGAALAGDDCDDADPLRSPSAEERCDDVDNDCDGITDDAPVDGDAWYPDEDRDGWGSSVGGGVDCVAPIGAASRDGDCADADPEVHPDVSEVCDGVDQDCDGSVDEIAIDRVSAYTDADADGYGDPTTKVKVCSPSEAGLVINGEDCDDRDSDVRPDADERCDEVDEDCDGVVDDAALDAALWHSDADGDGFGDPDAGVAACTAPDGYVADASDCNDADGAITPDVACDWSVRLAVPGLAELYAYSAVAQLVDCDGAALAVPAGGIATAVLTGDTRCAGDAPFVTWVVDSSKVGDQLAALHGDDGASGTTLVGWSGGYLQLFNPNPGAASVKVYAWDGSAWSSWSSVRVGAGTSSTVYTSWGAYRVVSDLPLTALGMSADSADGHLEYLTMSPGARGQWQFAVPVETGTVSLTGLCIDAGGCIASVDRGSGVPEVARLAVAELWRVDVEAGTDYTMTCSGDMSWRDEASAGDGDVTGGVTTDADLVPGTSGATLDTAFLFSTAWATPASRADRWSVVTLVPYEDDTTVAVGIWDGIEYVHAGDVTLDAGDTYEVAAGASAEVWWVESDAPIQLLLHHAEREFAFAAPALYYAD